MICRNCFTQISEANIVADVTFQEDSRGAAAVQGDFVGENARHLSTLGHGVNQRVGGGEKNKAQEVERNGRRALAGMCPRLGLPDSILVQAVSIYMMSANHNFSAGRRTDEVIAACLYAACRRRKVNTVMLIDISELLRMNVFRLGEVYKDLCRELYLDGGGGVGTQHLVEVESLIMKYCRKLEFRDATRQVAEDAAKIIRRMKRDWMVTGRHPAGLCGACIILAARMNNFRRSIREVVWVAKVADVTIAKRVEEFRRTKSAAFTVEEFREYAPRLKHQHDPPVLYESELKKQKFEAKKRQRVEASQARESQARESQAQEAIVISYDDPNDSSRENSVAAGTPAVEQTDEDGRARKRQRTETAQPATPAPTQQEPRRDADGFVIPALPAATATASGEEQEQEEQPKRWRRKKEPPPPVVITDEELADEKDLEQEIEFVLNDEEIIDSRNEIEKAKAEERSKQLAEQQKKIAADKTKSRRESEGITWWEDKTVPSNEEITPEDLEVEFENDPEVLNCLLSETERKAKEQIWVFNNEDWLRQQQEKKLIESVAKAAGRNAKGKKEGKTTKRRKRHKMGDGSTLAEAATPIETPADASAAMLQRNAPSIFVDFGSLRSLFQAGKVPSSTSASQPGSTTPDSGDASRDPTPTTGDREADRNRDAASASPTPVPRSEANRVALSAAETPATPERRRAASSEAPTTPERTPAQATEGARDDESEGDEGDYVRDELDYGADVGTPEEREDIGEDDYDRAIDPESGWSVNNQAYGEDYD